MANRLNISWPRLLAEGTAIVVSILLAFWIQAWWEDRTARIKTEELLSSLEFEWESDLVAIDTVLEDARRVSGAMIRVIEANQSGPSTLSDSEAVVLMNQQRGWHTYKPSTDALSVVLDFGLDNVESIELRMAIVSWPDEFRNVAAEKDAVEELALMHLRNEWSRIAHSLGGSWNSAGDPISDRWFGVEPNDIAPAIIADEEATRVTRRVLDMLSQYQRQLAEVRARLAENLALLQAR